MLIFLKSAWLCGLRSRSFHAVLVLGLCLIGMAFLAGSFSPRQPKTVALDVGLSALRFELVLLALFWLQELISREIDRRTVIFSLAYPVARGTYLVGRLAGIVLLNAVAALVLGLLLLIAVVFAGGAYEQQFPVDLGGPYWFTILAIWLDVAVVTAFALWVSSLSTVALFPLAMGVAFAIATRAFGVVRDYVAQGAEGDKVLAAQFDPILQVIGWVIPDLSRLDWRAWPMYRMMPDAQLMMWSAALAVAYIIIMTILAIRFFSRREFS